MMMDMPVMVAAIICMPGNVPSPVVVMVAAGGTVKMDRPLDRADAYSTPSSDQELTLPWQTKTLLVVSPG